MKKAFYFLFFCTSAPLMMMSCENSVPGTNLSNEYEHLVAKELAPMIQFLTEKYKKSCPQPLTDSIKARIYIVAQHWHSQCIVYGSTTEECVRLYEKIKNELKIGCNTLFQQLKQRV